MEPPVYSYSHYKYIEYSGTSGQRILRANNFHYQENDLFLAEEYASLFML